MSYVTPKKRLGQHFLKDQNIAEKIVNSVLQTNLPILEIGPGMGMLTKFLIDQKKPFKALDVDAESIEFLQTNFPENKNEFIYGDFLKQNVNHLYKDSYVVLGNFPYNISSQIFFKVLENRNQVKEVVGMLQKEVAERICEGPGNKTYGILSVLLQTFYKVEYLFSVSEKVFNPPPKVKSAVIRLTRNNRETLKCDEKMYFQVVKKTFNQRRKTIRNSLKPLDVTFVSDELLSKRPEQLNVDQFIEIATNVK